MWFPWKTVYTVIFALISCGVVRVLLLFLEIPCELSLVADFNYQYLIDYMHEGEYAFFFFLLA